MTQELVLADEIVTPTKWQKQHIPVKLQETAHVIHEGVDTDYLYTTKVGKKMNLPPLPMQLGEWNRCEVSKKWSRRWK